MFETSHIVVVQIARTVQIACCQRVGAGRGGEGDRVGRVVFLLQNVLRVERVDVVEAVVGHCADVLVLPLAIRVVVSERRCGLAELGALTSVIIVVGRALLPMWINPDLHLLLICFAAPVHCTNRDAEEEREGEANPRGRQEGNV